MKSVSHLTSSPKRLVILAQFDPDGGLPEHVRIHLDRLGDVATKRVLVSNSPMNKAAHVAADKVAEKVIVRPNIGWDFAAWRDAIAEEDMDEWDRVILTNSSIVGPLFPLRPIIEKQEAKGDSVWGMVLSHQHTKHLQSYFLAFDKTVIQSDVWNEWWSSVEDLSDKDEVIQRYELGFTQWLETAGFSISALAPDLKLPWSFRFFNPIRREGLLRGLPAFLIRDARKANRSVEFSSELIKGGMPYLKASLLWGGDTMYLKSIDSIKSIDSVEFPWPEIGL